MKSIKPTNGDRTSARRRAPPRRTGSSTESSPGAPKRKRTSQPKPGVVSKKIACVSCAQTDVPLMMGGRKFSRVGHESKGLYVAGFCRPCVDAGKTGGEAATPSQDVTDAQTTASQPQPQSETPAPTAAAVSKRIAGLAAPPLVSRSPLATNPPFVPEEPTDSTSVTQPDPPVAQP